jgi:hypothetical protein
MDLQPGTEYEVRLELRDPDGVAGEAVRTLKLKTRSEPALPASAVEVRHVYPPNYTGEKEKPFFEDNQEARHYRISNNTRQNETHDDHIRNGRRLAGR